LGPFQAAAPEFRWLSWPLGQQLGLMLGAECSSADLSLPDLNGTIAVVGRLIEQMAELFAEPWLRGAAQKWRSLALLQN
jgi:hypothetical protein